MLLTLMDDLILNAYSTLQSSNCHTFSDRDDTEYRIHVFIKVSLLYIVTIKT